jgi:hypothetical protein
MPWTAPPTLFLLRSLRLTASAPSLGFPTFCLSLQNIEAFSFDKTQHDLEAEVIVDSAANQWLHYGSQTAFNAYF